MGQGTYLPFFCSKLFGVSYYTMIERIITGIKKSSYHIFSPRQPLFCGPVRYHSRYIYIVITMNNLINKFNITIHTMECPRCHAKGSLIFYGHRVRKFIFVTRTVLINAQRCRCKECGAIHIILPSFVVPGFNHVYLSIRKVLNKEPDRSLEDSYFYRFIKSFFPPFPKSSEDSDYLAFLRRSSLFRKFGSYAFLSR